MYTFQSKIRYSEVGSDARLTLPSLIDYFQDCSTFQSETLGVGLDYLKERHMVWVLNAWQIEITRLPKLCEDVQIGTFPTEFKGFLGGRNFFMKAADGTYLAKANSVWSLLETESFKPVMAPQDMIDRYAQEPPLDMPAMSRKIQVPEGGSSKEPVTVMQQHLDTNHHVNNAQYVNMILPYVSPKCLDKVSRLRVEYKMQAFLGDRLIPYVVCEGEQTWVSLRNAAGKPYVNVEISCENTES